MHLYVWFDFVRTGHLTAKSDVYGFGVVLLEMLIGRKAMDKSRPSREHNLVEWARPLLIHNKKLLKIVDPRIEGQYTVKTLQKMANLAYHCLSQNPKGRPAMSQVVETLESLANLPESREDWLLQSSGTAVTLYEVPKETGTADSKRNSNMTEGESQTKGYGSGRRRTRPANGRSKSEPPKELQLYIPSPDSDGPQPPSTCKASAKPSIDENDLYDHNV